MARIDAIWTTKNETLDNFYCRQPFYARIKVYREL